MVARHAPEPWTGIVRNGGPAWTGIRNQNDNLTSYAYGTLGLRPERQPHGGWTNTYAWNARDQLSGISGGTSASFVYDGVGRRRSKTINSAQTGFLYDGLNFVQELTGSTVNANLITGGIDEVFLRKEGSTARHFMSDALGSVIALTDASGVMQTQYGYEPYGKTTVSGLSNSNGQRYTGREDDGIGLLYYRARYYRPEHGRFISEDPIGWESGQTNDYAYAAGDPISLSDPLGTAALGGGFSGFGWGGSGWNSGPSCSISDKLGDLIREHCKTAKRNLRRGAASLLCLLLDPDKRPPPPPPEPPPPPSNPSGPSKPPPPAPPKPPKKR